MFSYISIDARRVFRSTVDIAMTGHPPQFDGVLNQSQWAARITPAGINAIFSTGTDDVFRDVIVRISSLAFLPGPVGKTDHLLHMGIVALVGDFTPTSCVKLGVLMKVSRWQANRADEVCKLKSVYEY